MPRKPKPKDKLAPPPSTVRLTAAERDYCRLHGHGDIAEGVRTVIDRYRTIMRRALPRDLNPEEAKAICGATKGWFVEPDASLTHGTPAMGQALAAEIEDYRRFETIEAEQFTPDWPALIAKVAGYTAIEVLALAHAVEEVFAGDGELDKLVRSAFGLPA